MGRRLWLIFVVAVAPCAAHPISVTQASAIVHPDRLEVAIELFLEDLYLFHGLEANAEGKLSATDLRATMEKHKAFLLERFTVRDADGELLAGRIDQIDDSKCEIPADGVPLSELMAHSLVYHLVFPLGADSDPPDFLVFAQTLGNTAFGFPAEMLLELRLEGSEVPYQTSLRSNEPITVPLDWDDPPPPADASQTQWEEWQSRRREKTLGIESYSSVYSFLYIEDFEVRHEILVPLLSLEADIPMHRADPAFLDIAEQAAIKSAIGELFAKKTSVKIDGMDVTPTVDRVEFFGLDFKDFAQAAKPRRLSTFTARVGVILTYSTKGPPTTVDVTWNIFNKFLFASQTIVYAPDKTLQTLLSPYQKTFSWKRADGSALSRPSIANVVVEPPARKWAFEVAVLLGILLLGLSLAGIFRRWPALACGCVVFAAILASCSPPITRDILGRWGNSLAAINADAAKEVFQKLHKNIYRAFDYREEGDIYDSLSRSIDGPMLEDVYLDVKKGLVMREQGGAVARVTQVELQEAEPSPTSDGKGLSLHAVWNVQGTVEHWGHIHDRINQYEATFRIEPKDGAWKITQMDVERESPLSFSTRLRGIESDKPNTKDNGTTESTENTEGRKREE